MKNPYKILEIDSSASESEIKKAYRNLVKKYHPDINKDPDAENKFKEIDNAYKTITQKTNNQPTQVNSSARYIRVIRFPTLRSKLTLTFRESVLGCKKNICISRYIKCEKCDGQGGFFTEDICTFCNGKGHRDIKNNNINFTFITNCYLCEGTGKSFSKCISCNGQGASLHDTNFDINIPGGIIDGQSLRLGKGGHYSSSPLGIGYDDAFIVISVIPENGMILEGLDVISEIDVTLLEALQGVDKKINTAHGETNIIIPKMSKNKDKIIKNGFGAKTSDHMIGNHICVLNVKYPSKTDSLIEFLKNQNI